MSGFDVSWLDLREATDHASRDAGLRRRAIDHVANGESEALVVDLGAGTGSTLRALLPESAEWHWRLIDNDPLLLEQAMLRYGQSGRLDCVTMQLTELAPEVFRGARLVTASALFDLVSEAFLENLLALLGERGQGLYSALNYDGDCRWDDPHPMDKPVVAAFNAHQRSDKGLGRALGPDAAPMLRDLLEGRDFSVTMAPSPWLLGREHAELQRQFIDGMTAAAAETGRLDTVDVEEWRRTRLARAATSRCHVGHWDVLAVR